MKSSLSPRAALLLALALAFSVPVSAQWKWRDKNGQLHVSDLPPPAHVADKDVLQRPATVIRTRPPADAASAPAPAAADAKPRVDPELEARRKRAEDEQSAQRKKQEELHAAARAENCTRARNHLRSLEDGLRIARTNDKGEREVLDDAQRAEEIRRTRDIIASDCR